MRVGSCLSVCCRSRHMNRVNFSVEKVSFVFNNVTSESVGAIDRNLLSAQLEPVVNDVHCPVSHQVRRIQPLLRLSYNLPQPTSHLNSQPPTQPVSLPGAAPALGQTVHPSVSQSPGSQSVAQSVIRSVERTAIRKWKILLSRS